MSSIAKRTPPRIGQPVSRTDTPVDSTSKSDKTQSTQTRSKENNAATEVEASQSIPAPRRSGQESEPDYFSGVHNSSAQLSLEPNPFEQSFSGNPSADTPGKSLLPPVAALTSPSLPGTSTAGGLGWSNSLRAGPLSPAMLAGPAGSNEIFDGFGRGFPTPNESSLRTGLTPGGGGSMFPAPSPGAQSMLQQLQSGGATPSTLEFHRTALTARKNASSAPTSNPQDPEQLLPQTTKMEMTKLGQQMDPFTHPDATDAANGLFMLAKGQGNASQFPGQAAQSMADERNVLPRNENPMNGGPIGGIGATDEGHLNGDISDGMADHSKPNGRPKGKKANGKSANTANGRRKAEDTNKGSNKKAKGANGTAIEKTEDDEEDMKGMSETHTNGKKMTDEEKRKNFLERNRVAALKCRQRKKQWLSNLQAKVEMYSTENDALTGTVTKLREEIVGLKSLLLAHKDCPVTQSQGMAGAMMVNGLAGGDFMPPGHPYSIQMQAAPNQIPAQNMPRR